MYAIVAYVKEMAILKNLVRGTLFAGTWGHSSKCTNFPKTQPLPLCIMTNHHHPTHFYPFVKMHKKIV